MLTVRSTEVDKVMGLDLGADDYMTKPFSLPELLARLRALLRRAEDGRDAMLPETLAFGDVHLDFRRFIATRGGQPVHLTPKEFALVRYLAAQQGAAVRRDLLIDHVWGEDVYPTNRTVDTHVLSLRNKLEPDPDRPRHLLTVHGVGYRFRRWPHVHLSDSPPRRPSEPLTIISRRDRGVLTTWAVGAGMLAGVR